MTEVDYQLAILLQHKYEQERKDCEMAKVLQQRFETETEAKKNDKEVTNNLNDSVLARSLQEQFQRELEVERPGQNLVYSAGSSRNTLNNTKCLTDPSWEVIDPTPDIHNLFMAFNVRFFWNQLGSVCVCWSKRMTTCAGICSYQGRGGMCTISLSEPLLKLRPRKDLVETLLHEMIHAYLFITNNNRDRDGHGPEFHRHMNRINGEAGTNITVYHDFHDEVRVYQQHWWKCTGPCQNWKPYFGMVRRSMNRAPGPNDRWWAEHSQKCGGKFVKVKEPEKPVKSEPDSSKNLPDIRKFFSPTKGSSSSPTVNIKTISSSNSNPSVNKVITNSNNIFGFTGLTGSTNNKNKDGTLVRNNSNTIVVNKKSNTTTKGTLKGKITPDTAGKKLSETSDGNPDYSIVRNHWVNKFTDTNRNPSSDSSNIPSKKSILNSSKRGSSESTSGCSQKIPKLTESLVECPNCFQKINNLKINSHLDECINPAETKICNNCQNSISSIHFDEHFKNCTEETLHDDVFDISDTSIDGSKTGDKRCEVCEKMVKHNEYGEHVNQCLHAMYDSIEEKIGDVKTECLACNQKIWKSKLNDHLEECMNLSNIFDAKNEPVEGNKDFIEDNEEVTKTENTYNCPVCMKLVTQSEMNDHIDICLNIDNDDSILQ